MKYDHFIAVSGCALTLALAPLSVQAADIVQTLKDSGQFSVLVDAIEKAGLTGTLQGEGPYTVFAPTDEAFQNLQSSQGGQQQSSQGQQQAQSAQGRQSDQGQQQGSNGQLLQQASSDHLKQILTHHVVEGKRLTAKDVLGKEHKVGTVSGDQLTVDGTGTMVVLVPTGLSVARVGDGVFVRREAAAMAQPAVTVSTTGQRGQQDQQQAAKQAGQKSSQGQQQASGQSGAQSQEQPMTEQTGLLRAAMVVEPDIEADNGVIHAIDQVLVPQKLEQELMSEQSQSGGQQKQG